jgi:hypothetical protein
MPTFVISIFSAMITIADSGQQKAQSEELGFA